MGDEGYLIPVHMKSWLQLGRAQTFPASLMLVMVFFLLGGGELFSWFGLALFSWVWLSHVLTFGHNSLMDSCRVPEIGKQPYDAADKAKSHHPLINGRIKFRSAHKVIHFGLMFLVLMAVLLTYWGTGNLGLGMSFFALYIVCGYSYNCGLDKETIFAFVPISLCFMFLGLWGYFLSSTSFSGVALWLAIYIFLLEWFENGVEGCIKEIETSEVNMMKSLGGGVKRGVMRLGRKGKAYGWGIKVASLLVMQFILVAYSLSLLPLIAYTVMAPVAIYFCWMILRDQKWERGRMLMAFSCEEIVSIYFPLIVLSPILGELEVLFLALFGVAYFFLVNKALWRVPYPKV